MAKLSFNQIATGYGVASMASITTGSVVGYLWSHLGGRTDYVLTILGTWLLTVGIPSVLVSAESLRRALGQNLGTNINATTSLRRSIPVVANGKTSSVFMSVLPTWVNPSQHLAPTDLDKFVVSLEGIKHTLSLSEVEDFLYTAWRRQRSGKPGLSRNYWTKTKYRDKLTRQAYDVRVNLLLSVEGLIIDRGHRRSGKLAIPPQMSIKSLQESFFLG